MRLPTGPIRQKVREKASSYALDTPDSSSSSYGGEEYTSKNASADIYLFSPQEMSEIVISGEQITASLQGLCLPSEPVEEDDRLNYGQGRYEVETITPMPSAEDPIVHEIVLTEVQDNTLQA
jgi:hypothetical protein